MPGQVDYLTGERIVLVRSSGRLTEKDLLALSGDVARLFDEHAVDSVLIDSTELQKLPSPVVLFNFIIALSDAGLPRRSRIAILTGSDTPNDVEFMETVGKNRGIMVELFRDRREAIAWLTPAIED